MNPNTVFRRRARAALQDAFQRAGIPLDFVLLPHQDDHERLLVVSEYETRWLRNNQTCLAYLYMQSDLTGVVCGDNMLRISDSDAFDPEDYGFGRPFRFELPFDINDIEQTHRREWEELPKATFPRMRKQYTPKVIGSLKLYGPSSIH